MDHRPHIVVVEDEPAQRQLLVDYLARQGFRVDGVDGGAALRRLVGRDQPSLVMLGRLGLVAGWKTMVPAQKLAVSSRAPPRDRRRRSGSRFGARPRSVNPRSVLDVRGLRQPHQRHGPLTGHRAA